jgi:2-polyprenyl-6-methoxyphenol hydroxylase-like FAD-dependent oxidoreductase
MLGLLLARAGVDVLVLEKHADFLRDFRGDTLHPSTMELMAQMGLVERVFQLPHSKVTTGTMRADGREVRMVNFDGLRTPYPYIVLVPQWDFLELLTSEARRYPNFHLLMQAKAYDLIWSDGRVVGVRYRTTGHDGPDQDHEVRAVLTVAADGRDSDLRAAAGLRPKSDAVPIDVLWFRISRRPEDPEGMSVLVGQGCLAVFINRFSYWQVGFVVFKGTDEELRAAGLEAFRRTIADLAPEFADRVGEITDWEQVKKLSVRSNRLTRWYRPGFLCIGDSAHAMSPVGGVGINLAIQDAVVAANVLAEGLLAGRVRERDLRAIQRRRAIPVRIIQVFQRVLQNRVQAPALRGEMGRLPTGFSRVLKAPGIRLLPAHLIAIGVRRVRISDRLQELSRAHAVP